MKYYVKPYPNPRADDGETSGYWQHRSQVFGKPILNPKPEKVDLDGDGIVEALQQKEVPSRAIQPRKPIGEDSGLVSFAGRKPNKKISFDKTDIADGKITLDLTANDIDRLVQDLSHLGGENIATFGRNASVTIDASKLAELETLDSLAFGRTPKPHKPKPQPDAQLTPQPKDDRKLSFAQGDVDASGKIALDLVANDINQLVRDLYDIGVDGIITFGNNASVKIDANKIPALEQLPSLAFGRTTQRGVTKEDGKITGISIPSEAGGGTIQVGGRDKRFFDVTETGNVRVNFSSPDPVAPHNRIGTIGEDGKNQRGTKKKSQTKVGNSASQDNRETSAAGVVPLSASKEGSQDKKGADLSVARVKKFGTGEISISKTRPEITPDGYVIQTGDIGKTQRMENPPILRESRGGTSAKPFTSERTPVMISQRGERKISYDGMNFTSWKEGTPQPMPTESKPSTTIIIRSASFEDQARQLAELTRNAFGQPIKAGTRPPAGLTHNAFGQPISRPRFTSVSHTVGGSSSGGSSNSQVRAGSSSSRGTSGGGARVQVAPRASSSRGTSGGGQRVQWARG